MACSLLYGAVLRVEVRFDQDHSKTKKGQHVPKVTCLESPLVSPVQTQVTENTPKSPKVLSLQNVGRARVLQALLGGFNSQTTTIFVSGFNHPKSEGGTRCKGQQKDIKCLKPPSNSCKHHSKTYAIHRPKTLPNSEAFTVSPAAKHQKHALSCPR